MTLYEKLVADYTGLTMAEVQELCIVDYWQFLHDAVIYNYSQTAGGLDYLDKCWTMEQTKADRGRLREMFKKS